MIAKAGVRLAAVQVLAVVLAFALAGCIAQVSLQRISQRAMRDHVRGEAASLDDEFRQKGAAHLPYTVAKRSRLWRGFEYRLAASDGAVEAGRLPPAPVASGWGEVRGGHGARYLTYSHAMPDGAELTVGQDLATEAGETNAITQTLLLCGLFGVVLCSALSYLFTRGVWRRIAALSLAAHAVSDGRLDVRVSERGGGPRDDVDELGHAFNAMLERITLLIDQVKQVSTDIAHDLRTPLTRFRQKLDRLRRQVEHDPAMLTAVRGLEDDVGEILRTFDALLQLTEIQSPERAPASAFELGEIALRVTEAYRPDLEESGRTLGVRCEDRLRIAGDPDLLAQGLANLLENAMRHTPVGAHIDVEATGGESFAELRVSDDGPGIPAAERARALKPFVRLETSRHKPGSGLGLAIVTAIAARHGADMALEDAGPGLRVRLRFARIDAPSVAGAAAPNRVPSIKETA